MIALTIYVVVIIIWLSRNKPYSRFRSTTNIVFVYKLAIDLSVFKELMPGRVAQKSKQSFLEASRATLVFCLGGQGRCGSTMSCELLDYDKHGNKTKIKL